jgi:hypothetical protein
MLEKCKFGDIHCLSRYSPEMIVEKSISLMEKPGLQHSR